MKTLLQDIRYALRQLRKSPGFTATAILTLALGIGATTAIFTLVYQIILRSIPVQHPEQLYKVGKEIQCCVYGGVQKDWGIVSYDLYKYLRDQTPGTNGMAAVEAGAINVSARTSNDSAAQPLQIRFVSGNYFSVLSVQPFAGRLLTQDDDREGASPAAVITYMLWKTKFGGDPHLVGKTLMLTGHPVTLVGITAPTFLGERNAVDPAGMWVPLSFEPVFEPDRQLLKFTNTHWLDVLVRIEDRKQVIRAQNAVQGELHQWLMAHKSDFTGATDKQLNEVSTELAPASGGINNLRDTYESSLKLLMMVAGFVLLIACGNLANLMMVRGMARQQELSIRSALGAPRARLIRQTLVESILLGLGGGVLGLVLAYVGTRAIIALALPTSVQVNPLSATPSVPVLAFALGASLVTGILFGMAPAWITSGSNPVEALRGANRSTRDASALPQKILVILQAALSLALLSTAGLLITSLRNLEHQDFHFEPEGRLLLFIDLQAGGYKADRVSSLYQRFDDTFSHLPGMQNFAYATYTPMSNDNWGGGVYLPGMPIDPESDGASYTAVSPQFFDAVGTRILLGRGVTNQDTATSTQTAVVNQTFVNHYLKGKNPIGAHFGPDPDLRSQWEIVGVAEDTKYNDPSDPARPMYFTPMTQSTTWTKDEDKISEGFKHFAGNMVFHYQGDPTAMTAAVRNALKTIDPGIPIMRMTSYSDQLSSNFIQEELVVRLTSLFGLLAMVLASIGLYGVTAYAVARRTSEIGIRMALGASRSSVLSMIVKDALTQAAIGLVIGLPLALLGGRLVQHGLYQTDVYQPLVLAVVIFLLLIAALAAALIPARRAASIEPMQALRVD